MKKRKLNYIIHNPNTSKDTVKAILDIICETNKDKISKVISKEISIVKAS